MFETKKCVVYKFSGNKNYKGVFTHWTLTWGAVISCISLLTGTETILTHPFLAAVISTEDERAVFPQEAGSALAGSVHTGSLIWAVVQTSAQRAVLSSKGFLTNTLAINAQPPVRAITWTSRLRAVLTAKVTVAYTLAFDANALARAVIRTAGFRAVLANPSFFTNTPTSLHAERAMATLRDEVQAT